MKELYNSGQELKVLSVRAQEMCVNINIVLTYFCCCGSLRATKHNVVACLPTKTTKVSCVFLLSLPLGRRLEQI